jgi:hypothetical protein
MKPFSTERTEALNAIGIKKIKEYMQRYSQKAPKIKVCELIQRTE